MSNKAKIIWTKTDEAPLLATYSLFPIINAFCKAAGVEVETKDISLAGRVISNFPENLDDSQKMNDNLAELGNLTQVKEANIIKLPNISASIPQLQATIKELQEKGYKIPDFPEEPKTDEEIALRNRFAKALGSAANPVLREGNSDRRAAASVKKFAQKYPHKMMKPWPETSKTHVSTMSANDFYGNEKAVVTEKASKFRIELLKTNGETDILKDNLQSLDGEVLDGTFMSAKALKQFIAEQIADSKEKGVLFSVHLKATMMKISDPVIFGYFVEVFFKDVFEKHASTFKELGVNINNGLADLYKRLDRLPEEKKNEIKADIEAVYKQRPDMAMVNSDKGITNLHAPNDIIIDASMPVVIRDGGRMWNPAGNLQDVKCIIPDRCYSTMYQVVIDDCNKYGAYNPATVGNVSNVGLMAQKAEEYGSHPTTFIIKDAGTVRVVTESGDVLMQDTVEAGDIWRMSRAKDIPIQDWVKLAVNRAKVTKAPTIFWLDENRAHDAQIIKKVKKYLQNHDTEGLDIRIMKTDDAMRFTLERFRKGENTVSVTGNAVRDYLTDLFPIIELGTSARMLSIVPLLNGGGLFETGAGGSAPKHVQQFLAEGHLRWDSLGEFLALASSLDYLSNVFGNSKAKVLSETLDDAVAEYLDNGKNPSRKAGELDNRGSHFFLAQYWADALAKQDKDAELKAKFAPVAEQLKAKETEILTQIAAAEGKATNVGGYYFPNDDEAEKAMRPSKALNSIIDNI